MRPGSGSSSTNRTTMSGSPDSGATRGPICRTIVRTSRSCASSTRMPTMPCRSRSTCGMTSPVPGSLGLTSVMVGTPLPDSRPHSPAAVASSDEQPHHGDLAQLGEALTQLDGVAARTEHHERRDRRRGQPDEQPGLEHRLDRPQRERGRQDDQVAADAATVDESGADGSPERPLVQEVLHDERGQVRDGDAYPTESMHQQEADGDVEDHHEEVHADEEPDALADLQDVDVEA